MSVFCHNIYPHQSIGRGACNGCSEASALKVAGIAYTVNDLNSPTASMVRRSGGVSPVRAEIQMEKEAIHTREYREKALSWELAYELENHLVQKKYHVETWLCLYHACISFG